MLLLAITLAVSLVGHRCTASKSPARENLEEVRTAPKGKWGCGFLVTRIIFCISDAKTAATSRRSACKICATPPTPDINTAPREKATLEFSKIFLFGKMLQFSFYSAVFFRNYRRHTRYTRLSIDRTWLYAMHFPILSMCVTPHCAGRQMHYYRRFHAAERAQSPGGKIVHSQGHTTGYLIPPLSQHFVHCDPLLRKCRRQTRPMRAPSLRR